MGVPFWRSVRYTNDGCHLFQCLECKAEWESVTAPGWFDTYLDVPEECCCSFPIQQ